MGSTTASNIASLHTFSTGSSAPIKSLAFVSIDGQGYHTYLLAIIALLLQQIHSRLSEFPTVPTVFKMCLPHLMHFWPFLHFLLFKQACPAGICLPEAEATGQQNKNLHNCSPSYTAPSTNRQRCGHLVNPPPPLDPRALASLQPHPWDQAARWLHPTPQSKGKVSPRDPASCQKDPGDPAQNKAGCQKRLGPSKQMKKNMRACSQCRVCPRS